ncbi:MAG: aminomethyl-transferring glycine dehydrogenase subunit GcvPA [Nitrospinota bacterium]|nr:aminomethyl-transferring glycine dehydrogenase subunit GcvPA [Nitrospinota bacterium]
MGLSRVEDLFHHIPQTLRERAGISLPPGLSEKEVKRRMESLAARNGTPKEWGFFLGGGIYHHFIPSTVDAVISRSEFLTSYTPYQPEVSQGTLQTIFEYQTMMCQLTGMEVSNAGVYDGASAAAEAVLMARRIQKGRRQVLLSRALHPQFRSVITTYLRNLSGVEVVDVPYTGSGGTDMESFRREMSEGVMCAVVGYPNFFGVVEDLETIRSVCAGHGALLITATTEALSLALLKPPGAWGADIAVGEGQSLGVPMSLGGPAFGFFTCREKLARNLPGRLVGETVDHDGRRGFVLTLAAREQHIRREKATSNICTSQSLCTLAATVFMATLGKSGIRRLAEVNLARAHEVRERLVQEAGLKPVFGGPFFNEFVLDVKGLPKIMSRMRAQKYLPGIPLGPYYPELRESLLICVTEMNEQEEIDQLVKEFSQN